MSKKRKSASISSSITEVKRAKQEHKTKNTFVNRVIKTNGVTGDTTTHEIEQSCENSDSMMIEHERKSVIRSLEQANVLSLVYRSNTATDAITLVRSELPKIDYKYDRKTMRFGAPIVPSTADIKRAITHYSSVPFVMWTWSQIVNSGCKLSNEQVADIIVFKAVASASKLAAVVEDTSSIDFESYDIHKKELVVHIRDDKSDNQRLQQGIPVLIEGCEATLAMLIVSKRKEDRQHIVSLVDGLKL